MATFEDVARAMAEYADDPTGFLQKHRAGPSTRYDLIDDQGNRYPPAAIYQAAAGWDDARGGLKAKDSAGRRLQKLGFRVIMKGTPMAPNDPQVDKLLMKLRAIANTEAEARTKIRVGATDLRNLVMKSVGRCEISEIPDERLLVISHIVPWADEEKSRLDPDNVILLSRLWDASFDCGLLSFNDEGTAIFSSEISDLAKATLLASEKRRLVLNDNRRRFLTLHRSKYGFE